METIEKITTEPQIAFKMNSGDDFTSQKVQDALMAGIELTDDRIFPIVNGIKQKRINRLKEKMEIPIKVSHYHSTEDQKSCYVLGICDESDSLKEDQVFFSTTDKGVVTGTVLVTRNPCLHPGGTFFLFPNR